VTTTQPLRLDAARDELLRAVGEQVSAAWASFDQARSTQPPIAPELRTLLASGLPEQPTDVHRALSEAADILDQSLAQTRPRWFAFIGSSGLEVGVVADMLAACFDVNLAGDAAAASEVERQALEWLSAFLGYPFGAGACTSGGMLSNLTALAAARERALPGCRHDGLAGRRAAIYCSAEAHYSVMRAAEVLGLGSSAVRALPMDGHRALVPEQLAEAIDDDVAAGVVPLAAIATAGTTLTGALDPIDACAADVCEARGVWLHVDGAYGLPAAATATVGPRFAGLERADSVSVDAHKWLFLPKACGVVLVRDQGALLSAFAHEESYILHDDEHPQHACDTTLEYSRPFRALKLWLALRVHGAEAFRDALERNLAQARLLADEIRRHDDLELLVEPQLTIVPFRHAPEGVDDLDAHNMRLARALMADGRVFVAPAVVDGRICLRPCIVNFRTQDEDVLALVEVTRELGQALLADPSMGAGSRPASPEPPLAVLPSTADEEPLRR
jgi:aromatic-L-amino-acid decarboxylase